MYKKILVPLDGSPLAETILPHVEKLALRLGSEILLLYVDDNADFLLERDEVVDVNSRIAEHRQRIEAKKAYLQAMVDKWHARDMAAGYQIGHGPVVAAIIDCATQQGAELVAMSSHGLGGAEKAFYGSVAAGVLNRIDRPLLIVRAQF